MQSSPETLSLLTDLQSALSEKIEGATFREEVLVAERIPVVLMERAHALTAFAMGEEDDYQPLYEAFKKHYLKHTTQWSTKDVSFVFCIPEDVEVAPDFCSKVEVDVYFCRKYAVRVGETMDASLARLPFLPLAPITPGTQVRPPSAQKLLRDRNLKADLAAALVVPQKKGAARILQDCLEEAYGPPTSLSTTAAAAPPSTAGDGRVQTTLKSISIQNFRAYRTKKEFEFGSAVTVLYGPNGFGKTSFFDALDFVVTGGIGRLCTTSATLPRLAKHLDCDDDTTEVSLTLVRDGREHLITRSLADSSNAKVDGNSMQRKDVLSLLTGGNAPGADRVDGMVDLFRATHLFSQENQKLTGSVAATCELSSELVTKMLAFEDYASGVKKAEEVLGLAKKEFARADAAVNAARKAIEVEKADLERLQSIATTDASIEALDARFAALQNAVLADSFDMAGVEIRDTRAARSKLETAAAEAAAWHRTLAGLVQHVGMLRTLRAQLDDAHRQAVERAAQLQASELAESTARASLNDAASLLAQVRSQESNLQSRFDWLTWAASVQPEYAELTARIASLSSTATALSTQASQQQSMQDQAQAEQRGASSRLRAAEADFKAASERRASVQSVVDMAAAWTHASYTLTATMQSEALQRSDVVAQRARHSDLQRSLEAQRLRLAKAETDLQAAQSDESRMKALISELRSLVATSTCELCGHDHGTTSDLLAAIDKRMSHGERVVELSTAVAQERTGFEALHRQLEEAASRAAQAEQNAAQLQARRSQLEEQRTAFETALVSVGLTLSTETASRLQELSGQAHVHELSMAGAVATARQALATADRSLASWQASVQSTRQQLHEAQASLTTTREQLSALVNDANRGAVNLATALPELVAARDTTDVDRKNKGTEVTNAHAAEAAQNAAHASAKASAAAARTALQQSNQSVTRLQTQIQTSLAALAAARLDSSVTEEELRQRMGIASAREARALGLAQRVAELEVAVDTVNTSAAFQSIRGRILQQEKVLQEATAKAKQLEPWVAYFTEVAELLSTQQTFATDHFIEEYGPRTAVIQQRLRPVYGFDGIEVVSKDKSISINVHRNGEKLRPTDYFSQSQVQTLVLGLFLTACSSQTWSGFSSIMMDDPVTHFDDLNTYALLDLILGLQSSPEGERQFVISTCDEKLLQLARHKFRHMGPAAKFYRFQAIGAEGPMVSELSA